MASDGGRGTNSDPAVSKNRLFLADPTKALEEFKNELRKDIQGAPYRQDIESGILQFVEDIISRKISIRAHPTRRLHAKLYIFRPDQAG